MIEEVIFIDHNTGVLAMSHQICPAFLQPMFSVTLPAYNVRNTYICLSLFHSIVLLLYMVEEVKNSGRVK